MKNIFDTSDEKDSRIVEAFSNGNGSRVSIQPVAHVAGSHEAVGFPGNHGNRKSAWVEIYRKSSGPDHSPVGRYFVFQREKSASRYRHVVFTRSRHALRYAICIVPLRSRSLILALHEQAFQGRLGWFVASIKTAVRIFFFLKFPLLLLLFRACWIYRGYYRCCCYY